MISPDFQFWQPQLSCWGEEGESPVSLSTLLSQRCGLGKSQSPTVTTNGSKCSGIKGISALGRIVFKTKLLTIHLIDDSAGPNYVIRAVRRGPLLTKSNMHGPGWTGCLKPSCFCLFQAAHRPLNAQPRIRLLIILPYTDGLLLSSHNVKVVIWNRLDGLSYFHDYIQNPSDDSESEKKV